MNLSKYYQLIKYIFLLSILMAAAAPPVSAEAHSPIRDRPLIDILNELSEKYEVLFSYDSKSLKGVDVHFEFRKGEDLETAINRLLSPLDLAYEAFGTRYYVIHEKSKKGERRSKKIQRHLNKIEQLENKGNLRLQRQNREDIDQIRSITRAVIQMNTFATVTGKITDEEDTPLPGATIMERGTSNGTISDENGNFSLNVEEDAVLIISFLGYESQEVPVNGRTQIEITLTENISSLEEVVVVGYGTQKKGDVTGAITSVKGDVLNEIPVASLEQSLSGRMSGVQVINGSGVPGSGATIRVRGVGTVNNNEPLYVIDGIILGNIAGGSQSSVSPLSLINPSDIESIDVLKDASATAIYGARAGNGVVIITTKRGANERMRISYETYTSVNALDQSRYNQLTGPEWADLYNRTQLAEGFTDYTGQPFIQRILAGENIPTYDWLGELTRNGQIQSHNLSFVGGSERSNYFSSLSYFDQTGTVIGSDFDRFTLRFNSDHRVGKKFKIGNTLLLSRSVTNQQGNIDPTNNANDYIGRAVRQNPYKPIYRADGTYAGLNEHDPDAEGLLDQDNQHIIWSAQENINLNKRNRIWSSVYLDFEVLKGLTFHTMGSLDFSYTKREDYNTFNSIEGTQLVLPESTRMLLRNDEDRTWFIENTLTYNNTFSGDHQVTALLGSQYQNYLGTFFSAVDGAFENTDYWFFSRPHLINEVDPSVPFFIPVLGNGQVESGLNSYFGRLFYSYQSKYMLTATIRRDGSSKFGSERRWGTFPAVSVAWRLSQEDFLRNTPWLTDLKLRGGYGVSGSDNVANYQYTAGLGQGGEFSYSFDGGEIFGSTLNRNANTFIQWEEIKMANVGLDASMFNGRIGLSLDLYDKTTSGLFLPFQPALELGNEQNPNGNLGEVSNKGLDLALNTVNITGPFTWTTDVVFGTVRNRVVKLPENADRFASDGWQNNFYNITRVGEEIGAIYGYVLDGIFQSWDEVYSHAYQEQALTGFDEENNPIYNTGARDDVTARSFTAPGDFRFRDLNGDGFIDSENDRIIIGSTIPDFSWGLTNTFSFKGLMLSVFFQGVEGVNVVNTLKGQYATRERLSAWDGAGSTNSEPRIAGTGNGRTSSYRVEDASYVRLKNLRLGYSFPQQLINRIGLQELQFYATGTNLFTITDYTGYDPEVGLRTGGNNEESGVDKGQYPLTRQFSIGAKISF